MTDGNYSRPTLSAPGGCSCAVRKRTDKTDTASCKIDEKPVGDAALRHRKGRRHGNIGLDTKCRIERNGLFPVLKAKVFRRELDGVIGLVGVHIDL